MTDNPHNLPLVTEIVVTARHVVCPSCEAEVDGWLGDPRGVATQCDECDTKFLVHPDADFEMER